VEAIYLIGHGIWTISFVHFLGDMSPLGRLEDVPDSDWYRIRKVSS
jgi:hypothetical protein